MSPSVTSSFADRHLGSNSAETQAMLAALGMESLDFMIHDTVPGTSVCRSEWTHPYSKEQAAYPVAWLEDFKFWPRVGHIDMCVETGASSALVCR